MKRILVVLIVIAGLFTIAVWAIMQLAPFGGKFEGERLARMKKSAAYIDGRFENTPRQNTDHSLSRNYQLWRRERVVRPPSGMPVLLLDPALLKASPGAGLSAIWFGHASTMLEIDGVRVMTDPILSERASPFSFLGPKRYAQPPITLAELSGIDAVVISHDHYDHLDMATIQHLAGQGTHFFVGLGIGAHLERWGVPESQIHEMDWWESVPFKNLVIHCTPARHYSGRKSMDNSTLWASWLIKSPEHSFYFSGDTGYAPHFKEIRDKLGPVDLTVIKVGDYEETWFDIHMFPESSVQAHLDLGGKLMLPIHWGTFDLSYHAWNEPIRRTVAAAEKSGVQLVTPKIGERFLFGQSFANTAWFEQ